MCIKLVIEKLIEISSSYVDPSVHLNYASNKSHNSVNIQNSRKLPSNATVRNLAFKVGYELSFVAFRE
jgi:hypothetical protein